MDLDHGGAGKPGWGPEIGKPKINQTMNNSKMVQYREKVTTGH